MMPGKLRALIAAGKTLAVEFKGEVRQPLNDRDLVEAVICLANRGGTEPAWLLIGVEDDGRVTGARPRQGERTDPDRLAALIASRTRPSLSLRVFAVALDGHGVLAIEVPPQRVPVGTSDGLFLHRLVEAGLVEERGQKKGRTWHLSAAAYRALGDKAGYVRQRGFEPLQQEQMVLQYAEKHGRITRREAAEVCRISGPQAYRLLDRLTEQGLLIREGGRGRGVG